jgi:hypothetical protein
LFKNIVKALLPYYIHSIASIYLDVNQFSITEDEVFVDLPAIGPDAVVAFGKGVVFDSLLFVVLADQQDF